MNLFWTCDACAAENIKRTLHSTRVELAKNEGEEFKISCQNCHTTCTVGVDQLVAKKSKTAELIAGAIALLGTALMVYVFFFFANDFSSSTRVYVVGGYLIVPLIVYRLILEDDRRRVNAFNRHFFK